MVPVIKCVCNQLTPCFEDEKFHPDLPTGTLATFRARQANLEFSDTTRGHDLETKISGKRIWPDR